jgi:hypothetical protein
VPFLVQTATKATPADTSDRDRQVARDNRLAAIRALKNFDGSPEAAAAAGQLAENERDIAIRDRARETYAKVTGKEPPAPAAGVVSPPQPGTEVQLTGARQGQ